MMSKSSLPIPMPSLEAIRPLVRTFSPNEPLFGSAVAPYQVEGNVSGERISDWDDHVAKYPLVFSPDEIGPDWWRGKWKEDFDRLAGLGLSVQRMGIEWARIMPEKGKIDEKALATYRHMVDYLYANNMSPMLTVSHFVLPRWVAAEGGWEGSTMKQSFTYYTELLADRFGDVPYWVTINEPMNTIAVGYLGGNWPPGKKSFSAGMRAMRHLVEANDIAYTTIKKTIPEAFVGIANAVNWVEPFTNSLVDRAYTAIGNRLYNMEFINRTRDMVDFIGINFYTGYYLAFNPRAREIGIGANKEGTLEITSVPFGSIIRPERPVSDPGWPIVPEFFLDALEFMHKKFNKPIVITENGIADRDDQYRSFYLLTHLIALHEAQQRGVSIPLYIHWSSIDNQEWMDGFRTKFGLIGLDPVSGKRWIRRSAQLFSEIIRSRTIDVQKLAAMYLTEEERVRLAAFTKTLDKT